MALTLTAPPAKGSGDWNTFINDNFAAILNFMNSHVPQLDENGKLTMAQMPSAVSQGTSFQGTFDPTTGKDQNGAAIPAPSDSNHGFYWVASKAGSYTPPGGSAALSFNIGDGLASDGTQYELIPETTVDLIARNAANAAQETANNAASAASTAQGTANSAQTQATANASALNNKADKANTVEGYGITNAVKIGGKPNMFPNPLRMGYKNPITGNGDVTVYVDDYNIGDIVFKRPLIKLPLTAGFAANPGYYTKDSENRVLVTIAADKSTDISYNDTVGYLPAGFYPAGDVFDDVECLNASGSPNGRCSVVVRGGPIYVLSVPAGTRMLRGSIPYDL